MADIVWGRVLRVWSSLCHSGRTLRHRPILRDGGCLLFTNHRIKGALGRVGLRVHRTRTLLLPVYTFGFNASANKTNQKSILGPDTKLEKMTVQSIAAGRKWERMV